MPAQRAEWRVKRGEEEATGRRERRSCQEPEEPEKLPAGTEGAGPRVPSKKGRRRSVLMARWGMKLVFKSEGTSGNGRGGGTGAAAQWFLPTTG